MLPLFIDHVFYTYNSKKHSPLCPLSLGIPLYKGDFRFKQYEGNRICDCPHTIVEK